MSPSSILFPPPISTTMGNREKSNAESRVDMVTVSRLLIHERLETTEIYATLSPQDLEKWNTLDADPLSRPPSRWSK
jgi:hypothetical protein